MDGPPAGVSGAPSRQAADGGTTTRVSVASDGSQGDAASDSVSISADGRYVAFASEAGNLVPGDTNEAKDIFVHDRGPLPESDAESNLNWKGLLYGFLILSVLFASLLVWRRRRRRAAPTRPDTARSTRPRASAPAAPRPQTDRMLQQGIAQIRGEDTLEGYATLRRVVERAPRNAEAWLWMGWAAAQQKDHRTAQRCFLQAQRLGHPKAAQALEWLKG